MAEPANEVLILSGAPGSGKTTVARLLVAAQERAVHLESDAFFHFIASGYVRPWEPESHAQNQVVMAAVGDAAARYAHAGYFTLIDGIISPRWFFPVLREALVARGLRVAYAVLHPSLEVAVERARSRSSNSLSDPKVVAQLWRDFSDLGEGFERHVIDNTEQRPEATADALERRLQRGALNV